MPDDLTARVILFSLIDFRIDLPLFLIVFLGLDKVPYLWCPFLAILIIAVLFRAFFFCLKCVCSKSMVILKTL